MKVGNIEKKKGKEKKDKTTWTEPSSKPTEISASYFTYPDRFCSKPVVKCPVMVFVWSMATEKQKLLFLP